MRENIAGLLTGLIFGLGIAISGMAQPAVVQGFLDLAGAWDPRLVFVMAGGVVVTFFGYRYVLARKHPIWGTKFFVPTGTAIDAPLIAGAAIFGIGWGLAGYCPGPAVVSLASGRTEVIVFVISMLIGMIIVRWIRQRGFANMTAKA